MADELQDETAATEDAGVPGHDHFMAGPGPLVLAAVALAVSGILFIGNALAEHYVGYVCASVIAFSAVALNRRAIVAHATRGGSDGGRSTIAVSALLLVLGLGLAIGHAWFIARHYG